MCNVSIYIWTYPFWIIQTRPNQKTKTTTKNNDNKGNNNEDVRVMMSWYRWDRTKMVLEYQLQPKCYMLIRKHGIQLLSAGPRSTLANVARQLILCAGRGMRWVCIIVLLHIGRALCNHNRQVLPKIPRSGRRARCFDVYQLRQLEKR